MRAPRGLRALVLNLSALFGMRMPPEPEDTAQMAPTRGPGGAPPPHWEPRTLPEDLDVALATDRPAVSARRQGKRKPPEL